MSGEAYSLNPSDAMLLQAVVEGTPWGRQILLSSYFDVHGGEALAELFAQFIGLASSVVENNRAMIELYLITELHEDHNEAPKINLPTLLGALRGVDLARGVDQSRLCATCAFRLGTPPNQSPVTAVDAGDCVDGMGHFYCHCDLDDLEHPTKACVGYALKKRARTGVEDG